MSAGETIYEFVHLAPLMLVQGRAQVSRLRVELAGAVITPDATPSCDLVDGSGTVVATPTESLSSGICLATYGATALDDLSLGEEYQERWTVVLSGVTRKFRRAVVIGAWELHPPLSQAELTTGEYPDLVDTLGDHATSLQGFMDAVWREIIRYLTRRSTPPDVVVDSADVLDWHRHRTLERVFRANAKVEGDRSYLLWKYHEGKGDAAEASIRALTDRDRDGNADTTERKALVRSVHLNAAARARMPAGWRW